MDRVINLYFLLLVKNFELILISLIPVQCHMFVPVFPLTYLSSFLSHNLAHSVLSIVTYLLNLVKHWKWFQDWKPFSDLRRYKVLTSMWPCGSIQVGSESSDRLTYKLPTWMLKGCFNTCTKHVCKGWRLTERALKTPVQPLPGQLANQTKTLVNTHDRGYRI